MKLVNAGTRDALDNRTAFHDALRKDCPVAQSDRGDFYWVAGFDNVKEVLENYEAFTKEWSSQLARMEHKVALNQDPPEFGDLKRIYNAYMSPAGVKRWTGDCARIANDVIDAFIDAGSGDLQQLFGKPVPARVTALALGLPENQVDRYRAWTDAFLAGMIGSPERQQIIVDELYAFFDEQIEMRREKLRAANVEIPGPQHIGEILDDSLTSLLIVSPYRGRYLSNEEIRRTLRGFFVGGVDTTGALMLHTLDFLLTIPGLWDKVKSDPALLNPAIEETLRLRSPAIGMFREATRDVEMAGHTIPEGARVLYSTLSANLDPAHFEAPEEFRLDRKERHIAFGTGAHFCPGAWTARLEAQTALRILMQRMPDLRLTGPVEFFDVSNFWIVRKFPAAWD